MEKSYQALLTGNQQWVKTRIDQNPLYFKDLSKQQTPEFLWIGCSDSRVPAEEITQSDPGGIFVHRNIANLVVHTDLNLMSVLQYAVEVLHVKHVIVCGHYGCGGVLAAMGQQDQGLVNKWLRNIKDVYAKHSEELKSIAITQERADRLVELNVLEQVQNLAKTSIVQKAWQKRALKIHGWVFDMRSGNIKDLNTIVDEIEDLDPIFRFELEEGI